MRFGHEIVWIMYHDSWWSPVTKQPNTLDDFGFINQLDGQQMKTISPVSYQPTQAQVVTCKTLRSGPKQPTNNTRIGDGKSCSSRVRPWKTKIAMDIGHPPFSLGEYVFKWLSFQVCQCIFSKTNVLLFFCPPQFLFLWVPKKGLGLSRTRDPCS